MFGHPVLLLLRWSSVLGLALGLSTRVDRIKTCLQGNDDLAPLEMLRSFCPQALQLRQDHNGDGVYQIIIENVSNRQLKTNLLNTLASPGLQAIEPIATAEVVNGQISDGQTP